MGKKIETIDMESNPSASSGRGNNFFSGFLLGVIIGAAIVFLLGTKKGKKILKAISEEGEGKISSILDRIENSVDLPDEVLEDPPFVSTVAKATVSKKDSSGEKSNQGEKEIINEDRPKARRFFRGIPRRLN